MRVASVATQTDDTVPAATHAATASVPVVETIAPAPAIHAVPAHDVQYATSAPVNEHAAPTPVVTHIEQLLEPPEEQSVEMVNVCPGAPFGTLMVQIVDGPVSMMQSTCRRVCGAGSSECSCRTRSACSSHRASGLAPKGATKKVARLSKTPPKSVLLPWQCSAILLAICTVVDVSKCQSTQTQEVSAMLHRLPF